MLAKVLQLALWRAARVPGVFIPPEPLSGVREALVAAEEAVPRPPPPPLPVPPPRALAKVIPIRRASTLPPSAWDPEPRPKRIERIKLPGPPKWRDEELVQQEINGCKTLLLEVIRRAAYDWALYRGSRRMSQKLLAEQAFNWLFVEEEGTPEWEERMREGKHITAFINICESLDLDPDKVRGHIRRLTPKNVMSVGRPAEYRRRDVFAAHQEDADCHALPGNIADYDLPDVGDDEGTPFG